MLLYGKGILQFITFQSVNSVEDVQTTNGPLNQSLDFDDDSSEETSSQNPGQSSEEREEAPTTLTKKVTVIQSRPRCLVPLFQSESWCSAFHMKMSFHSHANKTHFHMKGCAPGLALKKRHQTTRKWPS